MSFVLGPVKISLCTALVGALYSQKSTHQQKSCRGSRPSTLASRSRKKSPSDLVLSSVCSLPQNNRPRSQKIPQTTDETTSPELQPPTTLSPCREPPTTLSPLFLIITPPHPLDSGAACPQSYSSSAGGRPHPSRSPSPTLLITITFTHDPAHHDHLHPRPRPSPSPPSTSPD